MKWIKAALIGMLGSLAMFIIMMLGINVTGFAPFNLPPSAAFLHTLGLNIGPLPLLLHFGYGAFWSVILVYTFKNTVSVKNGILLALGLWLFMMVVVSPIIGWGLFGFGNGTQLAVDAPLYLQAGPKYLISTLVLHLIYGTIIGWGDAKWVGQA